MNSQHSRIRQAKETQDAIVPLFSDIDRKDPSSAAAAMLHAKHFFLEHLTSEQQRFRLPKSEAWADIAEMTEYLVPRPSLGYLIITMVSKSC